MGILCFNPNGPKTEVDRYYISSEGVTVHVQSCGGCFCMRCTDGFSQHDVVSDASEDTFSKALDTMTKRFGSLSELHVRVASPIKQWLNEAKPAEGVYSLGK